MSASRLVGIVIAAIGYLSGLILVVQAFVPQLEASQTALLLLFPLCLLIGLPLYAVGEDRADSLRYSGFGLLLIGIAALLGVFVDAIGVLRATQSTLLWLIAPAGLFLGLLLTYFAGALERLNRERVTG